MTNKEIIRERFIQNNTAIRKDGSVRMLACFKEKYGNMSLEEAFDQFYAEVTGFLSLKAKINEFEKFLFNEHLAGRCQFQQSAKSESKYYTWNGVKYRFGSHVYPTGSMTDSLLKVVDLVADPELINEIQF